MGTSKELDKYLGKQSDDLSMEIREELLNNGYTISPRSGRIRKKLFKKKKFYQRTKFKKTSRTVLIVLLILLFIGSLFVILPQLTTPAKKGGSGKQK